MLHIDFEEHNEKIKKVWEAYSKGNPVKVPMILGFHVRDWIMDKKLNTAGTTWKDYLENKDTMWEAQLKTDEWVRFHILSDEEKGYPKAGWSVFPDFQNVFEEMWFGAELYYGEEPNTRQLLRDDNKNALFEKGIPDLFDGIGATSLEYYEYFRDKAKNDTYKGIPITKVNPPALFVWTDGPFTVACGLRGVTNFMVDMLEDPDYAWQLLDFITTVIIARIKKARRYLGLEEKLEVLPFADDAIAMLSTSLYRDMVLPFHKRLVEELRKPEGSAEIHLCGDSQRYFPIFEKEYNAKSFDTGFPVDFGKLYDSLSPDVRVYGGPNIGLLKNGTPQAVEAEVKRILQSGVMEKSKGFILREGNEVAPGTPVENMLAMYQACEKYGYYR